MDSDEVPDARPPPDPAAAARPGPDRPHRGGPGHLRLRHLLALRPLRAATPRRPDHGVRSRWCRPSSTSRPASTTATGPTPTARRPAAEAVHRGAAEHLRRAARPPGRSSAGPSSCPTPPTSPTCPPTLIAAATGTDMFTTGSVSGSGDWRVAVSGVGQRRRQRRGRGRPPQRGDHVAAAARVHRSGRRHRAARPAGRRVVAHPAPGLRPLESMADHRPHRSPPATSPSECRRRSLAPRSASSASPSTPCSARSRRRSRSATRPSSGCASSWPTPPHELRTPLTSIQGFAELFRLDAARRPRRPRRHPAPHRGGVGPHEDAGRGPAPPGPARRDPPGASARRSTSPCSPPTPAATPSPSTPTGPSSSTRPSRSSWRATATTCARRSPTSSATPCATRRPAAGIDVGARRDGDRSRVLSVRDHGPGLGADALAHAFDRFWQADHARTGAGAGLGLSIVVGHRRRARRDGRRRERRRAAAPSSPSVSRWSRRASSPH